MYITNNNGPKTEPCGTPNVLVSRGKWTPNTGDTLTINGIFTFYDSIFVFKNYNILILYDYKYYCDFKIIFNLLIP